MAVSSKIKLDDVLNSDQTPSLPEVALRIIEVAQQPDPEPRDLIDLIRLDPAIAGRILKFANSALFGLRHRPSSVDAAVPMLGTTLVRALVLGFTLTQQTPDSKSLMPWFRQLWRESLFQASAAEFFAEKVEGADNATWFLGGLLQDIGQLAMLNVAKNDYVEGVLNGDSTCPRVEREKEMFGFSHVAVSTELCRQWNLEDEIVTAISGHHSPVSETTSVNFSSLNFGLAASATCSVYLNAIGDSLETARDNVEHVLMEGFRYLPDEVQDALAEMDSRGIALANGFSQDLSGMLPNELLLQKAQTALRRLAVENQLQVLNGMKPSDNSEAPDSSQWVDKNTSTYNRRYLDRALPEELAKSHTEGTTVGLLKVHAPTNGVEVDEQELADVIRECVRPTDQVIHTDSTTMVVILQKLNADVLHRIAARMEDGVNQALDLPAASESGTSVGGVVVVPTGRKAAKADRVLKALAASTTAASQLSSSRIAFQLLTGKKARAMEPVPQA